MPNLPGLDGRCRAVIEEVTPQIDGGRFPIKREERESVAVEACVIADGHDRLGCVLLHRPEQETAWREAPMDAVGQDRWRGEFQVAGSGRYLYTVAAWVDHFQSWRHELERRVQAEDIHVALQVGAQLVAAAAERAARDNNGDNAAILSGWADQLRGNLSLEARRHLALEEELARLMARFPDRSLETRYERELAVVVEPERARFGAWYELFPRSCTHDPAVHGSFARCEDRLSEIATMGFDVLYLPPIHPIGQTFRKGHNNTLVANATDPGSPWAIGAQAGGHKSVHPALGTLEDFRRLVARALDFKLQVALDLAWQTSPDHPYVKDHPEWFLHRPDGSVQYAENPPKKYQDIYPLHFESDAWASLWDELRDVVEFWIGEGVTIFRVDNPHTKPFVFWEWLIADVKSRHPRVIFLAEAFSRPRVMLRLAKLGFSQSYTYFTWRNSKWELEEYLHELNRTEAREFFRPNFWPNTPDILPEYLQLGGRPAFMARLVLAATLAASYGIYGPAFELLEDRPREPGSEEYLDSEKYQIRVWETQRGDSLRDFIARVNLIRRDNRALQHNWNLRFLPVDNNALIAYSKRDPDGGNLVIVVVNLDPHHTQSGWLELGVEELAIDARHPYQVHDLLSERRFLWNGSRNYVEVNPHLAPAQIFRVRRRIRSEQDFEYFM